MKFACFDIETTGFSSTYNRLVCACFKFSNEEKPKGKAAYKYKDEAKLLEWITKQYDAADVIVTWNGKLFDVPFVNGRLIQHGMKPLDPKKLHKDSMYDARKLRMTSSRLEHVCTNLQTPTRKYDVPARMWILAAEGNREAHAEIMTHCLNDVVITEEVLEKLKPLMRRITA